MRPVCTNGSTYTQGEDLIEEKIGILGLCQGTAAKGDDQNMESEYTITVDGNY
jgi:hypothetical protein